ncbi:MAG: methyl-accepting chemotaxis protein [Oscillospiraceae bacterium]|nr:methyl-accepting chemotaxis protein [Oscillospiraceae bacterium]
MKKMSLKMSVLIPVLAVLLAGVTILVVIVGSVSSTSTLDMTERLMDARVNENSNLFISLSNYGYASVSVLAPVVEDYWRGMAEMGEDYDVRVDILDCLEEVLSTDHNILAIWTCWEPDALDGKDKEHVNINKYHDDTGRFVPYLFRDGSGINGEPLADYEDPEDGLYYQGARDSQKPYITDPYPYEIGGETIAIYSIAIPIIHDGKTAGVVGMDIDLSNVTEIMNAASILDDGYLSVISPNGSIATHRKTDMILESFKITWMNDYATQIESILNNGGDIQIDAYSDVTNTYMKILVHGVMIGETDRYWAVCGFVPQKTVNAASNRMIMLVVLVGVGLVLITGITMFALISNGLKKLPVIKAMAEKIAIGDVNNDLKSDNSFTRNEITLLERSFIDISNSIKTQAETMDKIAHGDYSVSVQVRSDADVMSKSINRMLEMTNTTLNSINSSTVQVSHGSKQVAEGAQVLAQGSTEQASVVEQLSASIMEINTMAKDNAENASAALEEAKESGRLMNICMEQMNQMTDAMHTINDKSKDIFKTTKVIDDIAFQTNILALNAAVEAARAGQHGKGFAVVAEEVRNLASKSAEAAKETASLLESSTKSVEDGNRIVEQVNESLKSVADLSRRNAEKVESVQAISAQQSGAMEQVSTGIDQVSQVIQQNSATAEQSAAASEEMSGQSDMLGDLVSQFKLKA